MTRGAMLRFSEDEFAEREAKRSRRDAFNNGARGRIVVPEREVQATILQFLKRHPKVGFAVRMNSGVTKYRDQKGVERFVRFGFKGCPDIWCVLVGGGRLFVIEVKSDSGALTDEQRAVLDAVNSAGGLGIEARSIDDVAQALEAA